MDIATIIVTLLLIVAALGIILYPMWQHHQFEAVEQTGRTLAEHQVHYQAALANIKDLMFDYEMGKLAAEDYQLLLNKAKIEAAKIRQQLDDLNSGLNDKIEQLLSQMKASPAPDEPLLQEVNAEIKRLATLGLKPACPKCSKPYQPGDAFCSGCGQALAS